MYKSVPILHLAFIEENYKDFKLDYMEVSTEKVNTLYIGTEPGAFIKYLQCAYYTASNRKVKLLNMLTYAQDWYFRFKS